MTAFERGSGDRPALSRCIRVGAADFAAGFWATGPLFSPADSLAQGFGDLFSAEAVDELVSRRGIRTPFMRMALEGSVLKQSAYTAPGGFGAEVGDQVSSDKVLAEFAAGATIVLQGLHRTWPPLIDFARRLSDDLGHPVQINAYITPASSRGFDPHYDVHDVFVLQIAGEKHWQIHEPVHHDPLRDQPWSDHEGDVAARAEGEPVIDQVFRPGDALYLPRGWIHSAEALGATSIHLTIGVAAYTRADVAESLLRVIGETPELRTSLPLGLDFSDPEALRPIVAEVLHALTGALLGALPGAQPAPDDRGSAARQLRAVSADLTTRFSQATRPEPLSPLATVDFIAALSGWSVVRWRGSLRATVESDRDSVRISAGQKRIVLPREASAAIERLHTGEPAAIDELPDLDTESALVVVRRLLREGIVVPA